MSKRIKTIGLRLYGKNDLRLEEFEIPEINADEILFKVETNSICMSSYKAAIQGEDHKRVPNNIAEKPVLIGHEMSGTILEVGEKYKDKFNVGMKCTIQPAVNYSGKEHEAIGYSYKYSGGNATTIIIPKEALEMDCLIPCYGDSFYNVSLAEPVACILAAFKEQFHYENNDKYNHVMGIKENGNIAILGGVGPMGLAAVDILLNAIRKPKLIVVTDIDEKRLERAKKIFPKERAEKKGIKLLFVNTSIVNNKQLVTETCGEGFDDVLIFAPVKQIVQQAGELMANGGCLNFFAGPSNKNFTAEINFYNVHYNMHHIIGSAGSNSEDLKEAVELIDKGILEPAIMVTHIGGLDSTPETILNLPKIPGGKKLIYTQLSFPLTALEDFEKLGKTYPLFAELAKIISKTNGLWSKEAEEYLLKHGKKIIKN